MKKELICGIYKITSPTGRVYVGQAGNIYLRWAVYKTSINRVGDRQQPKLYNSLRKYGHGNHKWEIVEQCSKEELNLKEIYWISFFNSFSQQHLNCNMGGKGNRGGIMSNEARKKMSVKKKNKKPSQQVKTNISNGLRASWEQRRIAGTDKATEQAKLNMSLSRRGEKHHNWGKTSGMKGKKMSQEVKEKQSKARMGLLVGQKNPNFGIKWSDEKRIKVKIGWDKLRSSPEYNTEDSKQKRKNSAKKMVEKRRINGTFIVTNETRAKLSDAGKKRSSENNPMFGKRGADNPNFGSKRSEEQRENYRKAWAKRKLKIKQELIIL